MTTSSTFEFTDRVYTTDLESTGPPDPGVSPVRATGWSRVRDHARPVERKNVRQSLPQAGTRIDGACVMEKLWQDLRYGARSFLRQPGFTLTAILALALGIGANTAVFSVVYAVLLKPLPYPDPGALLLVHDTYP